MQRALARLNPEHRAVIVLVGLEQLSYKGRSSSGPKSHIRISDLS
jgi:hypothetical protein